MSGAPDPNDDAANAPHSVLSAAGFYDQDEVAETAFARILLLGPGKIGKTTALLTTAPGPIAILNCDGDSATKFARKQGAKYLTCDITSRATWKAARIAVKKAVEAGEVRTVILDSVSILAKTLVEEISITESDKRALYGELGTQMGFVKRIFELPCHVFVVAHITAPYKDDDNEEEGILPLIPGQSKMYIPTIAHDIVLFDYVCGRTPERQFVIGPQKNWSYGGRNVKRSCVTPANVPALFAELGISP